MEPTFPLGRLLIFIPRKHIFLSKIGEMEFLLNENIICVFDVLV